MLKQYRLSDYRFRLILWVVALAILGILIIGSADADFQKKQIYGLILGVAAMVLVSLFDYTWVLNFHWLIYLLSTVLLGLVSSGRCRAKRCDTLDQYRISVSAIRCGENSSDSVFCQIF